MQLLKGDALQDNGDRHNVGKNVYGSGEAIESRMTSMVRPTANRTVRQRQRAMPEHHCNARARGRDVQNVQCPPAIHKASIKKKKRTN